MKIQTGRGTIPLITLIAIWSNFGIDFIAGTGCFTYIG